VTRDAAESAALAVNNGLDLTCGPQLDLLSAVRRGLITEATIDQSVSRLMEARFRLGMFDPDERVAWSRIPPQVVDSPEHRQLALEAARQSIVLLKNENNLLPLRKNLKQICVVGPNAGAMDVLLANYNGYNPRLVTCIEGICAKVGPATAVHWYNGASLTGMGTGGFGMALYFASQADVIIACMGLSPRIEGEEGDTADSDGGGDRAHINLPGVQEEFLKKLLATGKPVVLVMLNGSAVAINWAQEHVPAIVEAWYPGEEGGTAVADVLFGDYNPAGRLPVTFYKSLEQVPDFHDYSMKGRTYRYFDGEPLYPFGFGLSYTTFAYSDLRITPAKPGLDEPVEVSVDVMNTGRMAGDEVVQLYLSDRSAKTTAPLRELKAFKRIHLTPGQSERVTFVLPPERFARTLEDGRQEHGAGTWEISVGGGQPNQKGAAASLPFVTGTVTREA